MPKTKIIKENISIEIEYGSEAQRQVHSEALSQVLKIWADYFTGKIGTAPQHKNKDNKVTIDSKLL